MGTSSTAGDGILLHSGPNGAINLSRSPTGRHIRSSWVNAALASTFTAGLIAVRARLSCFLMAPVNTGEGDNLMTTQLGLSPGTDDGNHNFHFWSYHPNLSQFIMADGSGHS